MRLMWNPPAPSLDALNVSVAVPERTSPSHPGKSMMLMLRSTVFETASPSRTGVASRTGATGSFSRPRKTKQARTAAVGGGLENASGLPLDLWERDFVGLRRYRAM